MHDDVDAADVKWSLEKNWNEYEKSNMAGMMLMRWLTRLRRMKILEGKRTRMKMREKKNDEKKKTRKTMKQDNQQEEKEKEECHALEPQEAEVLDDTMMLMRTKRTWKKERTRTQSKEAKHQMKMKSIRLVWMMLRMRAQTN